MDSGFFLVSPEPRRRGSLPKEQTQTNQNQPRKVEVFLEVVSVLLVSFKAPSNNGSFLILRQTHRTFVRVSCCRFMFCV